MDFDILPDTGELVLNVPTESIQKAVPNNSDSYEPSSDAEQGYEFDCRADVPTLPLGGDGKFLPEPDYVNISSQVLCRSFYTVSHELATFCPTFREVWSPSFFRSLSKPSAFWYLCNNCLKKF